MKYKLVYFAISLAFIMPGIFSLVVWGLKPSIDFTGGALLEVKLKDLDGVNTENLRSKIEEVKDVKVNSIQLVGKTNNYIFKLNSVNEDTKNNMLKKINEIKQDTETIRFESVGPVLGKELLIKTAVAVAIVSIIILLYVAYQFKEKLFGLSAVLAMFHDTLILIGIFSILGHFWFVEVDTLFVTALLTTLSFSVHDTIVVFDRVREIMRHNTTIKIESAINMAVNQTMVRSLNNSITIIVMLTALALLGGSVTRWFVVAMLIGTVSGTYSSTFTAAPLLIYMHKWFNKTS